MFFLVQGKFRSNQELWLLLNRPEYLQEMRKKRKFLASHKRSGYFTLMPDEVAPTFIATENNQNDVQSSTSDISMSVSFNTLNATRITRSCIHVNQQYKDSE
eukprot:8239790-Ditylum_brightwellii.AAC.1